MKILTRSPMGWNVVMQGAYGAAFDNASGLRVIVSEDVEHDGKRWRHVSLSRADRIPSYQDVARVKRDFCGPTQRAVMVFPDEEHHVNIHPNCLHLFACHESDGLPDFTRGTKSL